MERVCILGKRNRILSRRIGDNMPLTAKNGILYDENGRPCGFACSKPTWEYCEVEGCTKKVEALCDFPVNKGTCDFSLCGKHRKKVSSNKDYCPKHNLEVIE